MAVYTSLSGDNFRSLLSEYDIGAYKESYAIAEGIENTNYLLHTDQAKYILTVYEKRVNREELPFFIALMQHLAKHDIPSPLPIADREGNLLRTVHGKPMAITSFLEGKSLRSGITAEHCRAVGNMLARMHKSGRHFHGARSNHMGHTMWQAQYKHLGRGADEVRPGLSLYLAETLDWLMTKWPEPEALPIGIIHADLFPDNVFFKGTKVSGLLDFYFACTEFLAYDVAITLNAWCFEHETEFNITKARAFLAGYQEVHPFTAEEKEALPVLCMGAAMRFLLSRLHDWLHPVEDALVTPKDPKEYLKKLEFHAQVKSVAEYGI